MKKNVIFSILLCIIIIASCSKNNNNNNTPPDNTPELKPTSIVILFTNDEHGWMEATGNYSGASGMLDTWKKREGYNSADSFLILSGGDMWTGPAISTWFKGEPMVEVMNEMEYDAAAIGNHEFDFSVDNINLRIQKMEFPLLAANIQEKISGNIPSFATPYIIEEIDGIKVGIIGLASRSTPSSAFPAYVEDYNFTSYSEAIAKYAPLAKADGADVLIIIGHISQSEMNSLVNIAKTNGISLIAGGHSHERVSKIVDDVVIIQSGSRFQNYVKVVLEYDKIEQSVEIISYGLENNQDQSTNLTIDNIINYWNTQVDNELSEVIGYCSENISQSSVEMGNLVIDSWLYAYPNADISMTNSGGIRQSIIQGEINLETIVGVLPFTNTLYEVKLTGTEVIDCIGNLLIGGMTTIGGYYLSDGTPIEANTIYSVVTTDYLYSLENSKFAKYDPNPYNTSILYMQPTVDWIRSKNTSAQNPINNYLDYTPRR